MNIDVRIQSTISSDITRKLIHACNNRTVIRIEDEDFRIVDTQLEYGKGTSCAHFALVKV